MTIIYERLKNICSERSLTFYAIEKGVGFGRGTLNKWRDSTPSIEKVLLVASFIDISIDYLVGSTDNPQSHKSINEFSVIAAEMGSAIARFSNEITVIMETHKLTPHAKESDSISGEISTVSEADPPKET